MFKRLSILAVLTVTAATCLCTQAADLSTNVLERAPAGTNDFSWLTAETLPPPGPMIDAAMGALPNSISERNDWVKRMRKAVWIPTIGVRYDIGQTGFRKYRYYDNRRTTTTSSDTTRESSSGSDSSAQYTAGVGSSQGTDVNGANSDNSSSFDTQVSESSSSGFGTSYSTGYSQTDEGPTSIALGDRARWVSQYGVQLSWDLSRLIFREEELSVVQAEINKEEFRSSVRDQVVQTYYDLKEAIMLLQTDAYKTSVPVRIRKERLAYLLDTMTKGALSECGTRGDL